MKKITALIVLVLILSHLPATSMVQTKRTPDYQVNQINATQETPAILDEIGLSQTTSQSNHGNQTQIMFKDKMNQTLEQGNYSLANENNQFQLQLQLRHSASIQINQTLQEKLQAPAGQIALSNLFAIAINDSTAVELAILRMKYKNTTVHSLSVDPQLLHFSYRNQTDGIWQQYNATVDISTQSLIATLDHFSEWMVTASIPQLRFVNTPTSYQGVSDEYLTIGTTIKNFGSYRAENVSVRLVTTPSVLLANISSQLVLDQMPALSEKSIFWNLYFEEVGEYSIVAIVDGNEVDGDILQVSVSIDQNEEISSNTSETSIFIQYPVIIVIMSLLAYIVRKRSWNSDPR